MGQAHTVVLDLCCGRGSSLLLLPHRAFLTTGLQCEFAILQQGDGCFPCRTGLLLEMRMRGSCHPSSCAVPPLPINKTAPCKERWFSRASVTLTQQCCISGCLVLFYLRWYLQCFVKYIYLGFVVCFNSQTSASSSKLSLRFFKSFA